MAQTEINTFSAVVDTCINRAGRPDRRADIISYARLSMRETQVLTYFFRDMTEDALSAISSDPYAWPTPDYFRQFYYAEYPHIIDGRGRPAVSYGIDLGKRQRDYDYFHYGSGNSIVFVGHGLGQAAGYSVGINVAYFSYFAPLAYFPVTTDRPARYLIDDVTGAEGWEYHADYDGSSALQQAGQDLVTNWMIERWFDVVLEGTLAKLYKTVDDKRNATSYALFKQFQTTLLKSEARLNVRRTAE